MGCSGDVNGSQATCVCSGITVFENAVIGQVFTGDVRIYLDDVSHFPRPHSNAQGVMGLDQSQGANGMRKEFSGYFDPTPEQLQALWGEHDSVIALDTNVLLGLYRMPAESRKEVIELLTRLKDRLWVPYHVVLEFHRNRLEAMRTEFAAAKQLGKDARIAYDAFKSAISNDRVRERACWPQLAEKLTEIDKKADELFRVTKAESDHYISPNAPDSVLSFVETLLEGRVGSRPRDQEVVDRAEEYAAERFKAKIGPGYYDQEKAGDTYAFDGLIYDRQYGDYMVWRELINRSRVEKTKRLMLITSDVKPDWWLDSKSISGKRPQPELVMEMLREASVDCFWMYTLSDFIKNARTFLRANVTQRAITDARQAEAGSRREGASATKLAILRRPIGKEDLRTVLLGYATTILTASPHLAVGLRQLEDKRNIGVLVVAGVNLITKALLGEFRSAVEMLGVFAGLDGIEVYVVFTRKQPEISQLTAQHARTMLDSLDLKGASVQVSVGHFLNDERTEYTFGT